VLGCSSGSSSSSPSTGGTTNTGGSNSAAGSSNGGTSNAAGTGAGGASGGSDNHAGSAGSTATGGAGTGGASSEPVGIQYYGRWDQTDPKNPSASWGPVGIKARFQGTSVSVKLQDSANSFTYSIDGGAMQTLAPGNQAERQLAANLTDGAHTLEFFRRSEGSYGKTVFSGLVLDPGKNLLAPDPRPPHRIEVVGDSISAGYGDEGMGSITPLTQNGYMAYGPQVARLLNAEWSIIAHSGRGMYRNLCEALPPKDTHMPDEFKLSQFPGIAGPDWDFSRYQPDVLIVTLGTNDFADYPPGTCAAPDVPSFQKAYQGFLSFARGKYPKAEIFALGTFGAAAGNAEATCNQTICAAVTATADAHVHCVDPSLGPGGAWLVGPDDYIGDWTHPTVAGHTKIANRLRDVIKPVLGW